ncbi:MAG: hypothetical protein EHJ95_00605, partial [Methanobacteriota archaeon]
MFDMTNNNETYSVPVGSQIKLSLPENPTTGYSWNLSVSSGLTINGDDYVANTTGPIVGAGGVHVWNMTAKTAGTQTITGVYRQQFDPLPGNETTFRLTLNVGGAPAANVTTPPSVPARYEIYTEAANGTTVQVEQGDEFGIRLAENPTTGYSWNLSASTGLQIMSDTYIPNDTTGQLVGSGGTHAWVFKANDAGNQTVTAVYIRPWEPTSAAGSYTLDVVVS